MVGATNNHSEVFMNPWVYRRFVCGAILFTLLIASATPARADALDNWTTEQLTTNWSGLQHVAYGNGRYVAGGRYSDWGTLHSSEDGVSWTLRVNGQTTGIGHPQGIIDLKFSDGRFVASAWSLGNSVGFSTDGTNWSFAQLPYESFVTGVIGGIAYGAGKYIVVFYGFSGNSKNYYVSANGTNWTGSAFNTKALDVRDVAYGPGTYGFVAVAGDGFAYLSDTRPTAGLTRIPNFVGVGTQISFCRNLFISPSSPGVNAISTNGFDWTTASTGVAGLLGRVSYLNGIFYARVGNNLAISSDGTNWTERLSSNLPGNGGIASDGRRFVNVGRTGSGLPTWNSFVHVSDHLVSVGVNSSSPPQINLSGVVGWPYRVEYLSSLPVGSTNSWQTLTNLVLPGSPHLLTDPDAGNSTERYYRAMLMP